jgi:hypothetical protein
LTFDLMTKTQFSVSTLVYVVSIIIVNLWLFV